MRHLYDLRANKWMRGGYMQVHKIPTYGATDVDYPFAPCWYAVLIAGSCQCTAYARITLRDTVIY